MAIAVRQSVYVAPPSAARILIADDHPVVRFGLCNLLLAHTGLIVVGEAVDGEDAIAKTLQLHPDLLLLDVHMPRASGLETLRAVLSRAPGVRVVLLSSTISPQQTYEALQLGARGVILKTSIAEDITDSIDAVMAGGIWVNGHSHPNVREALHDLSRHTIAATPPRTRFGLTPRELEVVSGIIEGCSNKDIALKFTISEETVKRHLSNIFDKTGVSTRLELALFAINHKVIEPQAY